MCVTVRTYYPFHVSFCYRKNIVSTVLGPVCIFFSFVSQFSYEVMAIAGLLQRLGRRFLVFICFFRQFLCVLIGVTSLSVIEKIL